MSKIAKPPSRCWLIMALAASLCGCGGPAKEADKDSVANPQQDSAGNLPAKVANSRDMFYQELNDGKPAGINNAADSTADTKVIAAAMAMEMKSPQLEGASVLSSAIPADGFKKGDSLRFHIRPALPCYVYVHSKGPSGNVLMLYPQTGSDNKLEAGQELVIPEHGKFEFDEKTGEELMLITLSTTPLTQGGKEVTNLNSGASINSVEAGTVVNAGNNVAAFTTSKEPVPMKEVGDKHDPYIYVDNSKDPSKPLSVGLTLPHS